jgi:hypothetical protein
MTTLNDVTDDVRRITAATDLPLMGDADTGWGGAFNIARGSESWAEPEQLVVTLRIKCKQSDAAIGRTRN